MVGEIDAELIIHFEFFTDRVFSQNFELAKGNQLRFQILIWDLHVLDQVMISDLWAIIEKHKNAHLVGWNRHLISLSIASNSCSYLCMSLIQLPMELSTRKFWHVILLKDTHALFYLWRNLNNFNFLQWLILLCGISTLVRPVARGQYFNIKINLKHLKTWTFLEVLHSLLRHFDVFEHNFKSLSELEAAFFFEFLYYFFLGIF